MTWAILFQNRLNKIVAGCVCFYLVLATGGEAAWAESTVAEPTGYRLEDYNAPVPDTLRGAATINRFEAYELWQAGTAKFIDVLPSPPRPAQLPETELWLPVPRRNIPGSYWLPETGRGELSKEQSMYYRSSLAALTHENWSQPLVIYCRADCWMSWNAAKRALEYGYSQVYWFPAGTDGWNEAGLPTEISKPYP